jgi:branched-chain amino acid transport system ATP-binding protein
MSMPEVLRVNDLHAFYGESHVLHGLDWRVKEGEVVTLLGRNGAGRTTTLRAILGLTDRRAGSVMVHGTETIDLASHEIARLGVGYCPEERGIYATLSCLENLLLPPPISSGGMSVDEIFELFPNLWERRHTQGTRLSGGEQQMLAMARILRAGSRLLLLDEISEGLAPIIVQSLGQLIQTLKQRGYTIVMVEQNFQFALPLADHFYVIEHGQVIDEFGSIDLPNRLAQLSEQLGV